MCVLMASVVFSFDDCIFVIVMWWLDNSTDLISNFQNIFLLTYQEVSVKIAEGVTVSSKDIKYLHLYQMAVGMNGADND